jgi:hypothetical protein
MATFKDPIHCFAPLEVVERLLEIRTELGYQPAIYLPTPNDLAACLDAYGFDVYAFTSGQEEFNFGDYRATLAPGGDHVHCSPQTH